MSKVKVYQIGVGNFGRYGFEKLIEMHKHLEKVELEFKGVAETDFEKRESAEKFAEANDIKLTVFSNVRDLYDAASKEDGQVLIYDSGPAENHADNIYNSMNHGFYHLAEKPPSMTRKQHIEERKLAKDEDVFWMADFIERESPVVKKTIEMLQNTEIESIEVFRESSVGIQKILQPVERLGVRGGDILDKMCHEIFVLDFLEASGQEMSLDFENADINCLMPEGTVSDNLMTIYGSRTGEIDESVATGQTGAVFSAGDVDIRLHSSWMGFSDECREFIEKYGSELEAKISESGLKKAGGSVFRDEEARFFLVKGEKNLLGDMLHNQLYDLDAGETVETPDLMHDQLYRVIEQAVLSAGGEDVEQIKRKEIDVFMNAIFDVRESLSPEERDFYEELERGKEKVRSLVVGDNLLEDKETEQAIG